MDTIITDGGKYEISKRVADLLRSTFIKQYESEPYHQHQNIAEQWYGVVKRYINTLMNLTGAPAHCWPLCLLYFCSLLNVTASPVLNGITPLQALTGQVPDISHFLQFSGNLSSTRYKKMNLPTDSLHNQIRKEDIRLDSLITKVIISPGKYLMMKHNKFSPDLLLELPTKLLVTSGWTPQKGRINHTI